MPLKTSPFCEVNRVIELHIRLTLPLSDNKCTVHMRLPNWFLKAILSCEGKKNISNPLYTDVPKPIYELNCGLFINLAIIIRLS